MWNRAFTLIEVIIAIFIILVGLLGVFSATQRIISYITLSNSKLTASYLAQEGIELVRNIRDNNWLSSGSPTPAPSWDDGLISCSAGCEMDYKDTALVGFAGKFLNIESVSGLYGYDLPGTPTKFKRKITIVPVDIAPADGKYDILEITVLIEWSERGESHSITAKSNLHDWRGI